MLSQRQYKGQLLQNETPEKREERLSNNKRNKKQRLQNETPEKREKRLCCQRQYNKQIREKGTPDSIQANKREHLKTKHRRNAKKDLTVQQVGCLSNKNYKQARQSHTIADLVTKFHEAVSQGPVCERR